MLTGGKAVRREEDSSDEERILDEGAGSELRGKEVEGLVFK